MQRDAIWRAETESWLAKSDEDIRAAELLSSADQPMLAPALFHCQQAVEKALKGFLVWHGQTFRKTHDIDEIGIPVQTIDPSLGPIIDRAVDLSPFAYKFRYPGQHSTPDLDKVRQSIAIARDVYQAVHERLHKDWSQPS